MDEVRNKEGRNKTRPSLFNNTTGGSVVQRYEYIPLDFIKTEVIGLGKEHFYNNANLLFTTQLKDKDQVRFEWCESNGMKLTIYPSGRMVLQGSLHKFHNNGEHNYDDFDYNAFSCVLRRLYTEFKVRPHNLRIINLEYGFNLKPDIKTNRILKGLLYHKNVSFDRFNNKFGNYYQAEHTTYILKVYNKGKQYKLPHECLRVEIKEMNWSKYRNEGIQTLQDFINSDKTMFVKCLTDRWEEVVFYDLTNKNADKWEKYSNELFWSDLRKTRSNKTFSVHLNKLKEINRKYGNNTQLKITEMIYNKLDDLQGVTISNIRNSDRTCFITGVDISMQRNDSFLLSHTGLYYLIDYNRTEFERLKKRFLSDRWINHSLQTQVKEIAHNIRATYNYRMKNTDSNQLTLFGFTGNNFQVHI